MAYKNKIGYYKSEIIINEGIDGEKIFYLGEITDFNLHKVFLLKSNNLLLLANPFVFIDSFNPYSLLLMYPNS